MSSSAAAQEAQIKSEIERLTATINQHKATQTNKTWNGNGYKTSNNYYSPYQQGGPPARGNVYVNPGYKTANKYIRPGLNTAGPSKPTSSRTTPTVTTNTTTTASTSTAGSSSITSIEAPVSSKPVSSLGGPTKEVVLGGVAFESSSRSLVRKDLPKTSKPLATGKSTSTLARQQAHQFSRKSGHVPPATAFKMKARRGRNMTLNNNRRPYSSSRKATNKRLNKYLDKPCPRFTTTGACSRGLTCMYQHDSAKIAICWPFLQDNCPNSAETCNLSHDPTPERTPLCVHFLNKGRCTRERCLYPHVNVGKREGVCRDFAVLGYCERGLNCDRQHVRECPDFAEKGTCGTRGCKLPHVIRANRNRKPAAAISYFPAPSGSISAAKGNKADSKMDTVADASDNGAIMTTEEGQLGDEYISLTFKESDSEDEEEEDIDEDEDENEDEDEDEDGSDSEMADIEVNM